MSIRLSVDMPHGTFTKFHLLSRYYPEGNENPYLVQLLYNENKPYSDAMGSVDETLYNKKKNRLEL